MAYEGAMEGRGAFWVELLVPASVAGFGVAYFFNTQDLSRQTVFFPHTLMVVMAGLVAFVLVSEWASRRSPTRGREAGAREPRGGPLDVRVILMSQRNPIFIIVSSGAYLALISLVGYFVATIAFISLSLLYFRVSLTRSLAIGLLFPGALFIVFVVMFGIRVI
jgi:hypothetical protein